jgi:hypothetical protein
MGSCAMDLGNLVFPAILFAVMVGPFASAIWHRHQTDLALTDLAKRHGLQKMDRELFDFPMEVLDELKGWQSVERAIGGSSDEDFLMVFDLEQGWGRNRYTRTIVARRYEREIPPTPRIPNGLILLESGRWRALTVRRTSILSRITMSTEDIESAWNLLAKS